MNTIAYVLILLGLLIVRGITRGRGIKELPDDLGDLFTGFVSADAKQVKEVLSRRTESEPLTAPAANPDVVSSDAKTTRSGSDTHTQAQLIGLGLALKAEGYSVGQGPAPFGPIGKHASDSYHYKGLALDINWPNTAQEPAKLDALAKRLKSMNWDYKWREAGHYDHLHVDTQ